MSYLRLTTCPRNLDALFDHQHQILSHEYFKHFTSLKELKLKQKGWFSAIELITRGRGDYAEFGAAWVGHQANGVKQLFVKTRGVDKLEGKRSLIGYKGHRMAMCEFLKRHYGAKDKKIRSITADTCDVDHVVPLSWLLKKIALPPSRVSAADLYPGLSVFKAEQASGDTVDYCTVMLTPSDVNRGWGSVFERALVEHMPRRSSLGLADFFSLAKVGAVLPPENREIRNDGGRLQSYFKNELQNKGLISEEQRRALDHPVTDIVGREINLTAEYVAKALSLRRK